MSLISSSPSDSSSCPFLSTRLVNTFSTGSVVLRLLCRRACLTRNPAVRFCNNIGLLRWPLGVNVRVARRSIRPYPLASLASPNILRTARPAIPFDEPYPPAKYNVEWLATGCKVFLSYVAYPDPLHATAQITLPVWWRWPFDDDADQSNGQDNGS